MTASLPRQRTEEGAASVEYGLVAVAVAAVIVAVVVALGGTVHGLFTTACTGLETQAATGTSCADG